MIVEFVCLTRVQGSEWYLCAQRGLTERKNVEEEAERGDDLSPGVISSFLTSASAGQ